MEDKYMELYKVGYNDSKIARTLNTPYHKVNTWRNRKGLKRNTTLKVNSLEEAKRRKLHGLGFTDKHIANEVGVTSQAIKGWRDRRGLSSNEIEMIREDLTPVLRIDKREEERRLYIFKNCNTYREMSEYMGICKSSVYYWARSRNLIGGNVNEDRK